MFKKLILVWSQCLLISTVFAQTDLVDTSFISAAKANLHEFYSNKLVDQIQLYNGGHYTPYDATGKEHPYFLEELEEGSIFYYGYLYKNEEMLYNTFTDKIIINDFYSVNLIQLISEKVDYFLLAGHTFVRLNHPSLKSGFYDLLVDGDIKLYAKRFKQFKEEIDAYEVKNKFTEKSNYYIFRDGNYYPVKNKRTVRNVLSDFDKELDQYIRKNKIVFRGTFESSVSRLIEFCNAL